MTGAERIAAERQRQIEVEGWTPEHDNSHGRGELFNAAVAYLGAMDENASRPDHIWPWDAQWWKPKDRQRNLVRAERCCSLSKSDCLARTNSRWRPR